MTKIQRNLEEFRQDILSARRVLPSINWRDPAFSVEKAYVCAVFAKSAYLKIPAFELSGSDGVKLVPCLTYQRLMRDSPTFDFARFMLTAESPDFFQDEINNLVVVVGIVLQDVIIISIRGTRMLYLTDWITDLNALKIAVTPGATTVSFHKGFYLAISELFDSITGALKKFSADIPVYVVGHSLGGAMAAILHGVGGLAFSSRYLFEAVGMPVAESHSSFTVGMPRYGDPRATGLLRNPYHCYNALDIVPKVPVFGYSNSKNEYELSYRLIASMPTRTSSLIQAAQSVLYVRGIRHHFVDRYVRNLWSVL